MFQIVGGTLGLGLTTARYVASSQARLDSDITEHRINLSAGELQKAEGILSGTVSPEELISSLGQKGVAIITRAVPDAFLTGITEGFMLDAILAFLGFLVALFFVGGRLRKRA